MPTAGRAPVSRNPARGELDVFIVEHDLTVRRGIELLLRGEGMWVSGVAETPRQASAILARRRYDVVLMAVGPLGAGSRLARDLLELEAQSPIVLYTGVKEPGLLSEARSSGAHGFVLKSSRPSELVTALRTVAAGGTYIDPAIDVAIGAPGSASRLATLSARELEILGLLADGLSGRAIADDLHISPATVRTHVEHARDKLGARTRVQAVAHFVRGHD